MFPDEDEDEPMTPEDAALIRRAAPDLATFMSETSNPVMLKYKDTVEKLIQEAVEAKKSLN